VRGEEHVNVPGVGDLVELVLDHLSVGDAGGVVADGFGETGFYRAGARCLEHENGGGFGRGRGFRIVGAGFALDVIFGRPPEVAKGC